MINKKIKINGYLHLFSTYVQVVAGLFGITVSKVRGGLN